MQRVANSPLKLSHKQVTFAADLQPNLPFLKTAARIDIINYNTMRYTPYNI